MKETNQLASLEVTVSNQVTKLEVTQQQAGLFQSFISEFKKYDDVTPKIYQDIRDSSINDELKALLLKIRITQDFKTECVYPVSFINH